MSKLNTIWNGINGEGRFTLDPHSFTRNIGRLKIGDSGALLVGQLMTYKWDERMPFPSVSALAAGLGWSERKVQRTAADLEKDGFLKRKYRKNHAADNDTTEYDLTPLFEKIKAMEDADAQAAREEAMKRARPDLHTPALKAVETSPSVEIEPTPATSVPVQTIALTPNQEVLLRQYCASYVEEAVVPPGTGSGMGRELEQLGKKIAKGITAEDIQMGFAKVPPRFGDGQLLNAPAIAEAIVEVKHGDALRRFRPMPQPAQEQTSIIPAGELADRLRTYITEEAPRLGRSYEAPPVGVLRKLIDLHGQRNPDMDAMTQKDLARLGDNLIIGSEYATRLLALAQ